MQKVLNFFLIVIFIILVCLFAYKTIRKPIVAKAKVHSNISQQAQIHDDYKPSIDEEHKPSIIESMPKEELHALIKDYIANNPDEILKSLEIMQKKKSEEASAMAADFLAKNKKDIEQLDSPPMLGNNAGDISIVVFYDYNCSFCKKGSDYINEVLDSDHGVKVVFRPFPILNETSVYVTKVMLAIHVVSPDNFHLIHNECMKLKAVNEESVKAVLVKHDIDYKSIENEVNSNSIKQMIAKNFELAKSIEIQGVPSYVINGHMVSGLVTTDRLKSIIAQIRGANKKSAKAAQDPLMNVE